ncbi:DUF2142 domain-containing protein, partial [bacterium]|nr:DUF2142 domain-containing protein [bacterium]
MRTILEKVKKIEFTRLEYIFLIIALVWGIFQIFLMPPYQVPDESGHFYRSWDYTNLSLFCDKDLKAEVPKNVIGLHGKFSDGMVDSGVFSSEQIHNNLSDKIGEDKKKVFTQFCSYNPIGHMPQSLGIGVARIFNLSPLHAFYFGRISNLIISILLIFFAIKITPFGKIIFFFSALLPMSLHQMASLSDDALVISGAFLFSALLFYFSTKKYLSKSRLLYTLAASLLLTQIKPGYIGLLALLLILKPCQFGKRDKTADKSNKMKYIKYATFIIGVLAINFLFFYSLTKLSNPDKYLRPAYKVSPNEQIMYIIKKPLNYAKVIGEELEKHSESHLKGMSGTLGMLSIRFSELFYIFLILSLFALLSGTKEKVPLNFFQRIVTFSAFLSVVLSIFTLEYIFWTQPMHNSIKGIQGRYFIAVFPLLIFSIYKIRFNKYTRIIALIIIFAVISGLTIRNIHSHYYKNYFTEKPQSENISRDLFSIIEEKERKDIEKISDARYIIKNSDLSFIITTENIKGISFNLSTADDISFT